MSASVSLKFRAVTRPVEFSMWSPHGSRREEHYRCARKQLLSGASDEIERDVLHGDDRVEAHVPCISGGEIRGRPPRMRCPETLPRRCTPSSSRRPHSGHVRGCPAVRARRQRRSARRGASNTATSTCFWVRGPRGAGRRRVRRAPAKHERTAERQRPDRHGMVSIRSRSRR